MNILAEIVAAKKIEIEALVSSRIHDGLIQGNQPPLFYQRMAEARATQQPFFIAEFKRKSPSEGWIDQHADLPAQIRAYAAAGAGAISVLTDEPFFGGTYADLALARRVIDALVQGENRPLLLQKDFILDPCQIELAKQHGADIILLIAAILEPERLDFLKKTAESLGLGVLVEVHDGEELEKTRHLDFPVLGINNRDLKTFRTALNRVNTLRTQAGERFVVAESGVLDYRHFQMVRDADGFLIGTGLMRGADPKQAFKLSEHFQSQGRFLLKACGIRKAEDLSKLAQSGAEAPSPDFVGINFSPLSKRQADKACLAALRSAMPSSAVAVFYKNTAEEIQQMMAAYAFKTIQLYAGDVSPAFVRSLKARVLMAVKVPPNTSWESAIAEYVEPYAADVDCFILDGPSPGSGTRIGTDIPADFPYPFLLAGGIQAENLEAVSAYAHCIGVDIASGIETAGEVDLAKIGRIVQQLRSLSLRYELPDSL